MEEEKTRHTAKTDKIVKHADQIKNLISDSEAGKKEIKTLFEMIEKQNKQIVEIKTVQRESRLRENAADECNDLWKRRMEGLLTYQIQRGIALEHQCTNVAGEQKREIEICRNRIKACEIQTEGLVKTAKDLAKTATETTDGLRYISDMILNLVHTQETAPQNNRALLMNQNEDVDAPWRATSRWANARTNANINAFN
ncbi:uncharacterized protein LOC132748282 [Ruditapes philippinarum]|uniref:uncharacterized protein LOC132748282 n=1 Tax=Ruditapes philippinarum TaxID=129788 RepID=UPI00295BB317|nr:uncharacterized protein LOC132748282 [Ruditapes philippinarum]